MPSTLTPGQTLAPGAFLLSPNHEYELVMQAFDGNLVLYRNGSAIWSTSPQGAGTEAVMQADGNLVLYDDGVARWSTNTSSLPGSRLVLQDDGNAVVYHGSNPVWDWVSGYIGGILSAGETLAPGAFLLSPNHEYELVMQAFDGNLVLYRNGSAIWSTTPQGAGTEAVMQADGNLVLYDGGTPRWATTTDSFPGSNLRVQDDGNAVVYHGANPVWDWPSGYTGGILSAGESLAPGAFLLSPNHEYKLVMQDFDGNLVLYRNGSALWSTTPQGAGTEATMQSDGNLVLYDDGGVARWWTGTESFPGSNLRVQDDGNAVIYHDASAVWDWESGLLGQGGGGVSILQAAEKWAGTPYCFAGGGPNGPSHASGNSEGATQCPGSVQGFDCTGLTIYAVYQATGKVLAHSGAQAANALAQGGHQVSRGELMPGDLVFFGGSFSDFEHVGIYAGGGMMWDANIAYWIYPDGVHERSLASIETSDKFVGAVRF